MQRKLAPEWRKQLAESAGWPAPGPGGRGHTATGALGPHLRHEGNRAGNLVQLC